MKETIKILILIAIVFTIIVTFMVLETASSSSPEEVPVEPVDLAAEETNEDPTGLVAEQGSVMLLTDEERTIVEQVVMAESGGEPIEGQMAVAQTIRDRMIIRNQSAKEVCTSPNQYVTTSIPATEKVKDAVMFVFDYGHSVYSFPTLYFYQCEMIDEPEYLKNTVFKGQIGPQRFYGE